MTTVIWKYPLQVIDRQEVVLPACSKLLSVANQDGVLCLWAWVEPRQPAADRWVISIIGTGNPVEEYPGNFIGSVLMPPFVWHVFARKHGGQESPCDTSPPRRRLN